MERQIEVNVKVGRNSSSRVLSPDYTFSTRKCISGSVGARMIDNFSTGGCVCWFRVDVCVPSIFSDSTLRYTKRVNSAMILEVGSEVVCWQRPLKTLSFSFLLKLMPCCTLHINKGAATGKKEHPAGGSYQCPL